MTDGREPPRRLRAADVIEAQQHVIDQLTTRTATEPSASVEITRNAKGDVQFSVKVFAPASADADAVEHATGKAYSEAVQAFESLRVEYPFEPAEPKVREKNEVAAIAANVAKRNASK